MVKLSRNYYLSIGESGNFGPAANLTIQPPFTVEFDINRHSLGSCNYAQFRIYNLSEKNAALIWWDWDDYYNRPPIQFQAGYGGGPNLPILFSGRTTQCQSVREGNNYITTIQAFDGGDAYANAPVPNGFTAPIGTVKYDLLVTLIRFLAPFGVTLGSISPSFTLSEDSNNALIRPFTPSGTVIDAIREIAGNAFYIDQGRANVIYKDRGEIVKTAFVPTINAASGLLGTPVREKNHLKFNTLFEPTLIVGQQIYVSSQALVNYNQYYGIVRLNHKGTISGAICGEAVTSIEVFSTRIAPTLIPTAS